jgi:hypothetical protein
VWEVRQDAAGWNEMGDGARYDRDKVRRMNKRRGWTWGVGKDWT